MADATGVATAKPNPPADHGDGDVWMPRRRMLWYQCGKIVTGSLMIATFTGWLLLQWANPWARIGTIAAGVITGWVVVYTVFNDVRRMRGRTLRLDRDAAGAGSLVITQPHEAARVELAAVTYAQWRNDQAEYVGLWFHGENDRPLVHLHAAFLANPSEARAFLGWLRARTKADFPVHWPA